VPPPLDEVPSGPLFELAGSVEEGVGVGDALAPSPLVPDPDPLGSPEPLVDGPLPEWSSVIAVVEPS
jgi:hypothetical protein